MLIDCIVIAVCCFVWVNILMQPGNIFNCYNKLIEKVPEWLYKPLGGCDYCFTGQVALWYFLFYYGFDFLIIPYILISIFIIHLIKLLPCKN